MVTEVEARSLSVREAARVVSEALVAVKRHTPNYERLRSGWDVQATTRARTELGLAILGYVNAVVALAAAKDRVGPAWAASTSRPRMFARADTSHDRYERAWRDYQAVRRTGDLAAVAVARDVWCDEFQAWAEDLYHRHAAEDQDHVEEIRRRGDESRRLHPEDAFGPRSHSRAQEIVHESREWERRESVRRAAGSLSDPWVRWPRSG